MRKEAQCCSNENVMLDEWTHQTKPTMEKMVESQMEGSPIVRGRGRKENYRRIGQTI